MQVFIVGSPMQTAMALDALRLNKQIVECDQILAALGGETAWSNHPCVLQYRGYESWLRHYRDCLSYYKRGHNNLAKIESHFATACHPVEWHTDEYYDQMKRRLYTKDPKYYAVWSYLGTSDENWYFVDGEWRKYVNGKRTE
jgi:hypothetical protein